MNMKYLNNECDGCFKKLADKWIPVGQKAPDRLCRTCARGPTESYIDKQVAEFKERKRQEYIDAQGRENTQGLINKELLLD